MDEFLSDDEVTAFTGYKQRPYRLAWLRLNGVPFTTSGKTKVTILRRHMIEAQEGKQPTETGLNMAAIA